MNRNALSGASLAGKAVAGTLLVPLLLGLTPAVAGSSGENPIEDARRAAEAASFAGVMQLRWTDSSGTHEERLTVEAGGGAFVVHGRNDVMAAPGSMRLVHHRGRGWDVLWAPTVPPGPRPSATPKYETASAPGPVVAGRSTNMVEIRHQGILRERMYLDAATGVLLRREQYGAAPAGARAAPAGLAGPEAAAAAEPTRVLAFETLTLQPRPPPAPPRQPADRSPRPVAAAKLPPTYEAPEVLADGYRRLGIYRRGDVVQVAYSDGIYDLSLFEQPGRLDRRDLPRWAEVVRIGGSPAWRYTWPGGHIVVWQGTGVVYSVVSDAPLGQVLGAVQSIPAGEKSSPSLLAKLRRAAAALVQPLSG